MARPHRYIADLDIPADHAGERPCRCGLARRNRTHDEKALAKAEERQAEHRRRIGDDDR